MVNSGLSGHKSKIVAAERAVVLARFPLIQLRLDQYNGERQSVATERFRQGDDIRLDTGFLEAEEGAGAPAASLDVINNQQHVVLAAHGFQVAQPLETRSVDAALALHGLYQDGGRCINAAA